MEQLKNYSPSPEVLAPDTSSVRSFFFNRLVLITLAVLVLCGIYLFQGAEGNLGFIQIFRLPTLVGLIFIAVAIGVSTLLFQTLSSNHILTPSLMGFDALYILLQTSIVFFFSALHYVLLPPEIKFLSELLLMVLLSVALFSTLLIKLQSDFSRMILTGIIFGILFRSLSGFMSRIMTPNDYAIVQAASFAKFNNINEALLPYAAGIIIICVALSYSIHRKLDVMTLGRDIAINLGVNHRKCAFQVLTLIAIMVATATALVGPVVFLGLLITSIVYRISPTQKHSSLIPMSGLIGIIVVVGGQLVLERLLQLQVTISIVIELAGGLVFLYLILKKRNG